MEFGFQSSFLKGYSLSLWELSLHRHDSHTSDHLCHRFRPAGGGEEPQQERSRAGAPARLPVLNQSKRCGSAALRSLCCFNAPGTKRLSCLYEWMNTNSMICLQASPPPPPPCVLYGHRSFLSHSHQQPWIRLPVPTQRVFGLALSSNE